MPGGYFTGKAKIINGRQYLSNSNDVFPDKESAELHGQSKLRQYSWYRDYHVQKLDDGTYRLWTLRKEKSGRKSQQPEGYEW
jgi:hypothetical protein